VVARDAPEAAQSPRTHAPSCSMPPPGATRASRLPCRRRRGRERDRPGRGRGVRAGLDLGCHRFGRVVDLVDDEHAVAHAGEGAADDLLAVALLVARRRVDHVEARLDCARAVATHCSIGRSVGEIADAQRRRHEPVRPRGLRGSNTRCAIVAPGMRPAGRQAPERLRSWRSILARTDASASRQISWIVSSKNR